MPTRWFEGEVIEVRDMSETVKQFFIKLPDIESFNFKAGQFITIDLPISEKRLERWRSYSIANAPDDSNIIELCIVYLDGGNGTSYLFNDVQIGTKLKMKGPSGVFVLPETVENDLVFICTGTGVAPFRSMLFDKLNNGGLNHNIQLIFGARYKTDILYRSEFEKVKIENDSFSYDICLSREKDWDGYQGYVHQVYLAQNFNENTKFFLCGWSEMIDEAVDNLVEKKNIDRKNIVYELYG